MEKPFQEGFELIERGIRRYHEENVRDIYYFMTENRINQIHSQDEFLARVSETKTNTGETPERILAKVKGIIEGARR